MTPKRAGTAVISASNALPCGPSSRAVMIPAPKLRTDATTRVPRVPPTVAGLIPGSDERTRARNRDAGEGRLCTAARLVDVSKGTASQLLAGHLIPHLSRVATISNITTTISYNTGGPCASTERGRRAAAVRQAGTCGPGAAHTRAPARDRAYRPALRPAAVAGVLRRSRHRAARRQPRGWLMQRRETGGWHPRRTGPGADRSAAGLGAGVRGHQLHSGRRARSRPAPPAARAPGSRAAIIRPAHARRTQPGPGRSRLGPAARADPGGSPEPGGRGSGPAHRAHR